MALEICGDLAMNHDTTVLGATVLVDINHPDRSFVLLVGLHVLLPFFRFALCFPVDRVFPQLGILRIAAMDAEMQSVAVVLSRVPMGAVEVPVRVTTIALFHTSLAGLLACVVFVDFERFGLGFVVGRFAGNLGLYGVSYDGYLVC